HDRHPGHSDVPEWGAGGADGCGRAIGQWTIAEIVEYADAHHCQRAACRRDDLCINRPGRDRCRQWPAPELYVRRPAEWPDWRLQHGQSAVDSTTRSEEHTSELQSPYDLVCR